MMTIQSRPKRYVVHDSLPAGLRVVSLRLIILMIAFLPLSLAYAMAAWLGWIRFQWYRRAVQPQVENVSRKLKTSHAQAERHVARSFQSEMIEVLEGALMRNLNKERIEILIQIRNLGKLDAVLTENKGAVLYSAHCWGNYFFIAALGILGYHPYFIRLKVSSNLSPLARFVHDRFNSALEKVGCRFLWMEQGRPGIKAQATEILKKNELVVLLIDMSYSKQNVIVNFFESNRSFPVGPVALAQDTGAPLLDFFVYREDEWVPQIVEIGSPFRVDDDIVGAVQHCASQLEKQIRQHPSDWAGWHLFSEQR